MATSEKYQVRLEKEQLIFSAAHFITYGDNICERLHGHNYRVRCEVSGKLDENGYVVDFVALRDCLQKIVSDLDHHTLLPLSHESILVREEDEEVHVRFGKRRWVFPADNCRILPVANTTAELLARYIARQLMAQNDPRLAKSIDELTVAVDENEGQWGVYTTRWMGP